MKYFSGLSLSLESHRNINIVSEEYFIWFIFFLTTRKWSFWLSGRKTQKNYLFSQCAAFARLLCSPFSHILLHWLNQRAINTAFSHPSLLSSALTQHASRICWLTCRELPCTAINSTSAARWRPRFRIWVESSSCLGWVHTDGAAGGSLWHPSHYTSAGRLECQG